MEEMLMAGNTNPSQNRGQPAVAVHSDSRVGAEWRARPQKDSGGLSCLRCDSTNTRFCYYNNFMLSQPRHYCKTCRRYWTHGKALRNVPVGAGARKKNKRPSSSAATSSSSATTTTAASSTSTAVPAGLAAKNHDLNMAFPTLSSSSSVCSSGGPGGRGLLCQAPL
ncbi:hypothetical protein U9M48_004748 [Paspalum notatum var. saurae]|uniref:Dof zinc finger protein n=1 Tax=Paspalum notatum var. saurae TaxID=547442 RepID=A0AAQ3PN99_PASNO